MFALAGIQNAEEEVKGEKYRKPYLKYLLKERINKKIENLKKIFKEGPPKYTDEQRRAMIMKNVEKKLS